MAGDETYWEDDLKVHAEDIHQCAFTVATYLCSQKHQDAWDLAQEVFTRVFQKRNKIRKQGLTELLSFTKSTTRNLFRDKYRRKQTLHRILTRIEIPNCYEASNADEDEQEYVRERFTNWYNEKTEIEGEADYQGKNLTEEQKHNLMRDVVRLRFFEEMRIADISAILGVSNSTVHKYNELGIADLRTRFEVLPIPTEAKSDA